MLYPIRQSSTALEHPTGIECRDREQFIAQSAAETLHALVSHGEWVAARRKHLAKEKEFTRIRDQLSRERRELPWERVEKQYGFEGERGRASLADLFEGRSQLVVYHAMFDPDTAGPRTSWTPDAACHVCSFWMDNFDGVTVHLNHGDITMAAVSTAPYAKIAAYRKRKIGRAHV